MPAAGPIPPLPAPRYWHERCTTCQRPKNAADSHCKSHTCPWCSNCARNNR